MKKTFTSSITAITIALIAISFTYVFIYPINSTPVDVKADWQLTVIGLVANPLNLNWTEIATMPKSTVNAAIICVDFPSNIVAQGKWTGIKLRTLLEDAEPSTAAIKVAFYAADGYSTDLSIETAMHDNIILAYEKDGEPLNSLRLVVPGKWGYKWISQLTRIELVDYNFLGFWESRGYSDEATIFMSEQQSGELLPLPKPGSACPSPTNPPAASPSPVPSQSPINSPAPLQPTPKQEPSEGLSIPMEVIYAIVASVIAVVLVALLTLVRKRKKSQ